MYLVNPDFKIFQDTLFELIMFNNYLRCAHFCTNSSRRWTQSLHSNEYFTLLPSHQHILVNISSLLNRNLTKQLLINTEQTTRNVEREIWRWHKTHTPTMFIVLSSVDTVTSRIFENRKYYNDTINTKKKINCVNNNHFSVIETQNVM